MKILISLFLLLVISGCHKNQDFLCEGHSSLLREDVLLAYSARRLTHNFFVDEDEYAICNVKGAVEIYSKDCSKAELLKGTILKFNTVNYRIDIYTYTNNDNNLEYKPFEYRTLACREIKNELN